MFIVKMINRADKEDIVINQNFDEKMKEAQDYYNKIKVTASADKNKVVREANEELGQSELRYCDVVLYLLEDEKVISKFMIG